MGLLDMFMGAGRAAPAGFPKTLNKDDMALNEVVAPNTTTWYRIGSYTVPAQQQLAVGYGDADHASNQGYLYISLVDSGDAAIEGKIRIGITNANETTTFVIFEERTEVLRGDLADKSKKIALPEQRGFPRVGEDSRIILEIMMDETAAIVKDDSTVLIPITVYQ